MPQITKPNGALLGLGVLFLLTGFGFLYKATSSPPIPNCEGAQGYYIDENLPEVIIDLKPDCWSGEFDAKHAWITWQTLDGQRPYDALFKDSYIYEGNRIIGKDKEFIDHPVPIRFKGTGKMKISVP
jgi:hypothetical protein